MNLKAAVGGSRMAYLAKITAAFEFSVLTMTVLGVRAKISKAKVISCSCAIFRPASGVFRTISRLFKILLSRSFFLGRGARDGAKSDRNACF
jgi:hypothetical protein